MPSEAPGTPSRVAGYRPPPGVHDELMTAAGEIRPHWRAFMATLETLRVEDEARRWALMERLLRENGLTYDIPGQEDATGRPHITLARDVSPRRRKALSRFSSSRFCRGNF